MERGAGNVGPRGSKIRRPRLALAGETKMRYRPGKREFYAQEGRYITGRRNNQPPTRVAFASTDSTFSHKHDDVNQTERHTYENDVAHTYSLKQPIGTFSNPLCTPRSWRRIEAQTPSFSLTPRSDLHFLSWREVSFHSIRGNASIRRYFNPCEGKISMARLL